MMGKLQGWYEKGGVQLNIAFEHTLTSHSKDVLGFGKNMSPVSCLNRCSHLNVKKAMVKLD